MKHRHITMLLVLGVLLGHADQLHAQRPRIVRPPQKSPWLAATLELILPTVGHAYAGDAMAIIGSRVWAFGSALRLARRTNAFYRRRLGLNDAGLALSVTPGGQLGLGVRLRF